MTVSSGADGRDGGLRGPDPGLVVRLAPPLLGYADADTAAGVATSLGAAAGPGGVRIEPAGPPAAGLVHVFQHGRELALAQSTVEQGLAYVLGDVAVPRLRDADAARGRLAAVPGGPGPALTEWLSWICRATLTEDDDPPFESPVEPQVEIFVEPRLLRRLTSADGADLLFPFVRDGLFTELGLRLPAFHLRRHPPLRPDGFFFRLAGVELTPRIGLAEGAILVNEAAADLEARGIPAVPTTNPATGGPASIVPAEHDAGLVATGLTTWSPFGHLILCFAEAVRRHAYRFVTTELAGDLLEELGAAWPVLLRVADAELARSDVAVVLRELVREQVSVRNLRRIVELLLRNGTEDAEVVDGLAFVRRGLARQIGHMASRGTTTVVAYLVDPSLEQALADGVDGSAAGLRGALADEARGLPENVALPVVLTADTCRRAVRDALTGYFPRVQVVGYRELPPEIDVQSLARLEV